MIIVTIKRLEYRVDINNEIYKMSLNYKVEDPFADVTHKYSINPSGYVIKVTDQWTDEELITDIVHTDHIIGDCKEDIKSRFSLADILILTDWDDITAESLALQSEGRYGLNLDGKDKLKFLIYEGEAGEWTAIKETEYSEPLEAKKRWIKNILGE